MGTTEHPEAITHLMCKYLVRRFYEELKQFSDHSNAELCEIEGLNEPAWVIRLFNGKKTNYAVYEAVSRNIYIYYGGLKPVPLLDMGQVYHRSIKRHGKVFQEVGRIWTNRHQQVCLKWERI